MRAQAVVVIQRTSLGLAILSLVGIIEGIIFSLYLSRAITRHLREAIAQLTTSSTEILATTTQVASSTAEEATEVNETTATVEEVRQAETAAQSLHELGIKLKQLVEKNYRGTQ